MKTLERNKDFSAKAIVSNLEGEIARNYTDYNRELAEKAYNILSYRRLDREGSINTQEKINKKRSLDVTRGSLVKLEKMIADGKIRPPFKQESVEKYKKKMVKADKAGKILKYKRLSFLLGGLAFLGLLAYSIRFGRTIQRTDEIGALLTALGVIGSTIFSIFCFLKSAFPTEDYREAQWNEKALNYLDMDVPEFVLQTAVDIKQEIPNAEFLVSILTPGYITVMPSMVDDPFLILVIEDQKFYMEVWNEPNFKAQREE